MTRSEIKRTLASVALIVVLGGIIVYCALWLVTSPFEHVGAAPARQGSAGLKPRRRDTNTIAPKKAAAHAANMTIGWACW